jgi:hypothetical protein
VQFIYESEVRSPTEASELIVLVVDSTVFVFTSAGG